MVDIKRVNFVSCDDWVWLFIDNKCYEEGHSVDSFNRSDDIWILKLAEKLKFTSKDVDQFVLEGEDDSYTAIGSMTFSEVMEKFKDQLNKLSK